MPTPYKDSHATTYRVQPSVTAAVGIFLIYAIVVVGLECRSGIPYERWFESPANAYRAIVLPFAAGSLLLGMFTSWLRWDFVWRDRKRTPMHWLLWLPVVIAILTFVLRLLGLYWTSLPSDLIVTAIIGASLVAFAEETLFRGIILRGLRSHNRTEGTAIVVSTVWFGAFHLVNALLGLTIGEAILQSVFAACLGAILYLFRRGTGWLVAGMIAHALWDLPLFLHKPGSETSRLFVLAGLLSILLYAMGMIVLLVSWFHHRKTST